MNKLIASRENECRHWRNMWQGYIDDMRSPDWPIWEQRIVAEILHQRIYALENKQEWKYHDFLESQQILSIILCFSDGFFWGNKIMQNINNIYKEIFNEKE